MFESKKYFYLSLSISYLRLYAWKMVMKGLYIALLFTAVPMDLNDEKWYQNKGNTCLHIAA